MTLRRISRSSVILIVLATATCRTAQPEPAKQLPVATAAPVEPRRSRYGPGDLTRNRTTVRPVPSPRALPKTYPSRAACWGAITLDATERKEHQDQTGSDLCDPLSSPAANLYWLSAGRDRVGVDCVGQRPEVPAAHGSSVRGRILEWQCRGVDETGPRGL